MRFRGCCSSSVRSDLDGDEIARAVADLELEGESDELPHAHMLQRGRLCLWAAPLHNVKVRSACMPRCKAPMMINGRTALLLSQLSTERSRDHGSNHQV